MLIGRIYPISKFSSSGPSYDGDDYQYRTRQVTFVQPFTLGTNSEVYPAGTYTVETKTAGLYAGNHTGHVRKSTVLVIPTATGVVCREISGRDLDNALNSEAEIEEQRSLSENPDRGEADEISGSSELKS